MAQINTPDTNMIGNVLGATALAFLVDKIALGGTVAGKLPSEIVSIIAFVIFGGVFWYGYRQLKKLN